MTTNSSPLLRLTDVTAQWEEAATREDARGAIHPAGHQSLEAYIASGRETALELGELIGAPGPGNLSVIDFGAGDGRVAIPLAALGYGVIAVDAAPTMLDRLAVNAPELPSVLSDGRDLYADIADALLEPDPFEVDVVIALAILIHHRHADAALLLRSLRDVVRPGGRLIIDLPIYEVGRDPNGWTEVSVWTLPELNAVAELLELDVERAIEHAGTFQHGGPSHDSLVVLRRRA